MRYYTEFIPKKIAIMYEACGMNVRYLEKISNDGLTRSIWREHPMTIYGDVYEFLMNNGLFVMAVPTVHPSKYRIGDEIDKWDCFVNGKFNGTFSSWQDASDNGFVIASEMLMKIKQTVK